MDYLTRVREGSVLPVGIDDLKRVRKEGGGMLPVGVNMSQG
jgi:hypothetical protein